jgi:MFS superfamily sulfate permease-like transporter
MKKYLRGFNIDLIHSLAWWNLAAIAFGLTVISIVYFLNRNGQRFRLPFSKPVFILVLCYVISVASVYNPAGSIFRKV